MLINVLAVASTAGDDTSVTWSADATYDMPTSASQIIPGRIVSGTISPGDDVVQATTGYTATVDSSVDGEYLYTGPSIGGNAPSKSLPYVGPTGVFEPAGLPYLASTQFLYVNPPNGNHFALPLNNQTVNYNGIQFVLTADWKNKIRQGSLLTYLNCKQPTFTVPSWARSFTLHNVSGADLYYRGYRPNSDANLIDTAAASLSDNTIVGAKLATTQSIMFHQGDFTPGASYMLTAAIAATGGAIVEFYP